MTVAAGADLALLRRAAFVLRPAVLDLRARRHAAGDLERTLASVERDARGRLGKDDMVPYFIPNDLSRCTERSVLNHSCSDDELDLPAGFSIEASATRPNAFALPYSVDPRLGLELDSYADRHEWRFDLAFVGQRGVGRPEAPEAALFDPRTTRFSFLRALVADFVPSASVRIRLRLQDGWFRSPQRDEAQREDANRRSRYVESVADSRYVLCPRGSGANSFRFFEALAACNIPIYVGNRTTKFPLDWIIDWDTACFRISCEEVLDGTFAERLHAILATPIDEVNRRRRYIFQVYHQFLAAARAPVFDQLVLLRARDLLRSSRARRRMR